ncbi:TPA: head-tail connector protein [Salmonella enterica subsp. enterica]|uniref:Phage gp6-like head-tail connector protein n=1 Tax=Salmonella enterica TaxID=28901 RepID=A0A742UGQ8_SALER|nr:phage gp6-like head-tail connector protein [Salmonella enterica]ECI5955698.1 phage gp6-like head-tail connector protein [Salmonella enterica subsp. enterica serovar Hvittingfoss]ECM3181162.1 phage gp6-like head-tail connector protein [Salmonella enterica subsp. enterica serovar Newport]HAF1616130.1 phage gp6-like head-tail connector protein [Salmonella enterica]
MKLTSADIKTQLRMDPSFTEHDDYFESLIAAAKRSIERDYYCRLVDDDSEQAVDGVRLVVMEEDIALAVKYLVADAYLNNFQGAWLDTQAVRALLFPIMEHTV